MCVSHRLEIMFLVQPLPVGYHESGKLTRCTDRFVRYPYLKHSMNSAYKKDFSRKQSLTKHHKLAFNLEKEAKIINPHPMEIKTTAHEDY